MYRFLLIILLAIALTACSPTPSKPIFPEQPTQAEQPPEKVEVEVDRSFLAVVGITAAKAVEPTVRERDPAFNNPFIEPNFDREGTPIDFRDAGRGMGFLIDSTGLIATAAHIVADDEAVYEVSLASGAVLPAKILKRDLTKDIALLQIDAGFDLPVLPLADSSELRLGQPAMLLNGTPGKVMALDRELTAGTYNIAQHLTGLIETDLVIRPGDSGGPLFNMDREVIGILSVFNTEEEMMSFAVPIEVVKSLIAEL